MEEQIKKCRRCLKEIVSFPYFQCSLSGKYICEDCELRKKTVCEELSPGRPRCTHVKIWPERKEKKKKKPLITPVACFLGIVMVKYLFLNKIA